MKETKALLVLLGCLLSAFALAEEDAFDDASLDESLDFDPASLPPSLRKAWEELQNAVKGGDSADLEDQFDDMEHDDVGSPPGIEQHMAPPSGEDPNFNDGTMPERPDGDEYLDFDEARLAKELERLGLDENGGDEAGAESLLEIENQLRTYMNQLKSMKDAQEELEGKLHSLEGEGGAEGEGDDSFNFDIDKSLLLELAADDRLEKLEKRVLSLEAEVASLKGEKAPENESRNREEL